jgi:exosortase
VRAALAFALATTIAVVYGGTIGGLWREWTSSPDASYGLLLTTVALVSIWARRADLARALTTRQPTTTSGFVMFAAALLLYLVGQLGADVFLTRVSLVAVITGSIWFVAGPATARAIAAPLLFLLIAVPLPALVVNAITLPMQLTASRIAEHTLAAGGMAVFRDGNVLELPSASLEVAEACSGLRSAISLAAIGVLLASIGAGPAEAGRYVRSWWRRVVLVAAAIPIAIVINGLRIAATAVATETWGADAATGAWHTFGGWITFIGSVAILIALQRAIGQRGEHHPDWRRQAVSA